MTLTGDDGLSDDRYLTPSPSSANASPNDKWEEGPGSKTNEII